MAADGSSVQVDYLPRLPINKDTGIGCIGSGFIMADCHLEAYAQAGFNPVAIASRNSRHAREVATRHGIPKVYDTYQQILSDPEVEVVDIAVPPDVQLEVVQEVVRHPHIRGILAQKPLSNDYDGAKRICDLSGEAGITLGVNQNMRYDQSVRACKSLLDRGELGDPVLATIDMRAIPHWMPWHERLGSVTLRILRLLGGDFLQAVGPRLQIRIPFLRRREFLGDEGQQKEQQHSDPIVSPRSPGSVGNLPGGDLVFLTAAQTITGVMHIAPRTTIKRTNSISPIQSASSGLSLEKARKSVTSRIRKSMLSQLQVVAHRERSSVIGAAISSVIPTLLI